MITMKESYVGKFFRVVLGDVDYVSSVGYCSGEDLELGIIFLEFPDKGDGWWSLIDVQYVDPAHSRHSLPAGKSK